LLRIITSEDIKRILDACDQADLYAWETSSYWGSVRPVLEKELNKLINDSSEEMEEQT